VVGEAGDFGLEVAGYHIAEFAEGVVDDVGILGGFGAGHFRGEADRGVRGAVDGGDAAENAGHADRRGQAALFFLIARLIGRAEQARAGCRE
jgi:hypothetical protein